jgi:FXSXX-COOH protein
MVDVSEMPLSELVVPDVDDQSPLAHSLRRVAGQLDDATEQIAGFNSAL